MQRHKELEEEKKKASRPPVLGLSHHRFDLCPLFARLHSALIILLVSPVFALTTQKEEAEAAKLYEEFVESFGEAKPEENSGPKAFLRGGTIQPGSSAAQAGWSFAFAPLLTCMRSLQFRS